MIYTRSPYYIDIDGTNYEFAGRYELKLYVWKGDSNAVPSLPNYIFKSSLVNKKTSINISNYINDSLSNSNPIVTSGIIDNDEVVNIRVETILMTAEDQYIPLTDNVQTNIAIYGYTLFQDGKNFTPSPDSDYINLFTTSEQSAYNDLILGFFTSNFIKITAQPSGTILINTTFNRSSTLSNKKTYYLSMTDLKNLNDEYLVVENGSDPTIINLVKECKHEPITCLFKNRWGAFQTFTFFKKHTENIRTTKNNFTRKSYDRQNYDYNVNGVKSMKLNTGYYSQEVNKVIEELLLSEDVFLKIGNGYIPYNIESSSLEFKTKLNDKLISYELEFTQAFNTINNV